MPENTRSTGNWLLVESGAAVTRLMDIRDGGSDSARPGGWAQVAAHQMLLGLASLNFSIAATDVYSDPDGAIRLFWTRDDRSVELVFPLIEEAPYLYHSDEHNYGVEENPSPERVLKWINWVLNDVLPGRICFAIADQPALRSQGVRSGDFRLLCGAAQWSR